MASPVPKEIIELESIRDLVERDVVVVSTGGGGIPVVKTADGTLKGADAVIDKDLATALLAKHLKADILIISTETGQPKYRKEVLLPASFSAAQMSFQCRNGILEIALLKEKKKAKTTTQDKADK